jgi:type I site-specific restriction-modification system R (restriction) subunit
MDRNEKPYMEHCAKLSLDELRSLFKNLKDIGMSDDDIEKYAKDYYAFFKARREEELKYAKSGTIFIGDVEAKGQVQKG